MNKQSISNLIDFTLIAEASSNLVNKIEIYARIEKADIATMREKGNNGIADSAERKPFSVRTWVAPNGNVSGKPGAFMTFAAMPAVQDIQNMIEEMMGVPESLSRPCAERIIQVIEGVA